MHYVGSRNPLAEFSPLRSIAHIRTVASVVGASNQEKADAELRLAGQDLTAQIAAYAAACADLGKANRRPVNWKGAGKGCRAYHQGLAMRAINARRKLLRPLSAVWRLLRSPWQHWYPRTPAPRLDQIAA